MHRLNRENIISFFINADNLSYKKKWSADEAYGQKVGEYEKK